MGRKGKGERGRKSRGKERREGRGGKRKCRGRVAPWLLGAWTPLPDGGGSLRRST